MDFDKMCSDYSVFESVFSAPPDDDINLMQVQQDICAAEINMTSLLDQIKANVAGLTDFMDSVSQMLLVTLNYDLLGLYIKGGC